MQILELANITVCATNSTSCKNYYSQSVRYTEITKEMYLQIVVKVVIMVCLDVCL